jgi:succinate-acetate transporter protein
MVLAMGLFYGGIAQVIAGILEFKKGNTFGLTAFTSYGLFWLTLVALLILPKLGLAEPSPPAFMGCYLALWGAFTLFMFLGTLRAPRALSFVFASLTVLFALLAIRDFTESKAIGTVAGWEGILCGASAVYLAMAEVLNERFGRVVLPVGAPSERSAATPIAPARLVQSA